MRLISNKKHLIANIETIENYIIDGNLVEKEATLDLIRKGKCLVAYKVDNDYRFAPSRFLGYQNNTLIAHFASQTKTGLESNAAINKVLESKLSSNENLENRYIQYCLSLGLQPSNYSKRRYWYLEIEEDFAENKQLQDGFPEGKIVERIHKSRERNFKLIETAKLNFKNKHGRLFCEICGFDFEKKYGAIGKSFIEAHHTIPVSEMQPNHITKIEDIALLCSNCHGMVHIRRPWLKMKELTDLITK